MMFLPESAASQRPILPPQQPTPISVRLYFECPFTLRPYRIYMIAGQPFYVRQDLPLAMQQRTIMSASDQYLILDDSRWLELVPESLAYTAIRRAFPEPDHPFRAWHGDTVRQVVERWRFEEAA